MEILALVAKGNSSPQIAEKLFISPDRVRTHRKNLFRKTETKSVGEFVRKYIEWGLVGLIFNNLLCTLFGNKIVEVTLIKAPKWYYTIRLYISRNWLQD